MNLIRLLNGKPTPAEFAAIVIKALRHSGQKDSIVYRPDEFKLVVGGGKDVDFFLNNAYADYLRAPRSQRRMVIHNYIRVAATDMVDISNFLNDVIDDILPVIRSRSFFELNNLRVNLNGTENVFSPYSPISDYLAMGLCYDTDDRVMYLNQNHLDQWEITFEQLLVNAKENLQRRTELKFNSPVPGLFISEYKDSYDVSRLIFSDMLNHLNVKGKPVAVALDRDTLVVTGSDDEQGIVIMASLCEKALQNSRFISATPVILQNGAWTTLSLDPDHPGYSKLRLCEVQERMQDFNEQKPLLESWYEKKNEDIFVANYSAFKDKDSGKVTSYCIWIDGVPADLPVVDQLIFMGKDKSILAKANWQEAFEVLGDMMKLQVQYPPRYRVEGFPTEEQLGRIRLKFE